MTPPRKGAIAMVMNARDDWVRRPSDHEHARQIAERWKALEEERPIRGNMVPQGLATIPTC